MQSGLMKLKNPPKIIANPEEELKKIVEKISFWSQTGKPDNENRKEFDERMAGYFALKRQCKQQINNERGI